MAAFSSRNGAVQKQDSVIRLNISCRRSAFSDLVMEFFSTKDTGDSYHMKDVSDRRLIFHPNCSGKIISRSHFSLLEILSFDFD